MWRILGAALLAAAVVAISLGCSSSNLEYLKAEAPKAWREQGFEVVAYEGYKWGEFGMGTPWGGAKVWFRLKKLPDNGITYSGYLQRWGSEIHVFGPFAADAIRP